jgi:hypothetical protein
MAVVGATAAVGAVGAVAVSAADSGNDNDAVVCVSGQGNCSTGG